MVAVAAERVQPRPMDTRRLVIGGRIAFGLGLVAAWHLVSMVTNPFVVASPLAVVRALVGWLSTPTLYRDIGVTLWEAGLGVVIGTVFGIGIPILLRLSNRLSEAVVPFVRAMLAIPKLALAPIFILWLGFGPDSKVALVTLIVFIMVFEATVAGIEAVDRRLVDMARILGANQAKIVRKIILESVRPYIFAALKTALPFSVNAAVVGEFLASHNGLGHRIMTAMSMRDIPGVFAGVIIVTTLVLVLDFALAHVKSRSLAWQQVDMRAKL